MAFDIEDRQHRPPAEVAHDKGRVPAPGARDHQDRRRGKVGERAADGHVHEQQAQRRVLQARRRLQVVELARQQQRADRHRRRLGDERPQHRADRQNRQPPRAGVPPPEAGDAAQRGLGKHDDGPRRGQRHDHDDEHRLGVVDRVVEVVRGGVHPRCAVDGHHQHDGPEAEDHLDLAEKVQQLGRHARLRAQALGAGARSSCRCCTSCASAEKRAARNVWTMASTKMPVTTTLNGSASSPGRRAWRAGRRRPPDRHPGASEMSWSGRRDHRPTISDLGQNATPLDTLLCVT